MYHKREQTPLEVSIFDGLSVLQNALSQDQFATFAKAVNIPRHRLVKIISREENGTMTTLLKLAVFLQFLGIITLFEKLDDRSQLLLTLYAVSGKGIEFFFSEPNMRDGFIAYVRGKRSLPSSVHAAIGLAIDTCPEGVHTLIVETQESMSALKMSVNAHVDVQTSLPASQVAKSVEAGVAEVVTLEVSDDTTKLAKRFGAKVEDMSDFVVYLLSDAVGPDGRRLVREVVGQEKIFDLKNRLARLCSEEAFRSIV